MQPRELRKRILELVDFGSSAKPVDVRKYRNKRAEMAGEMREWLIDADIPDQPLLETELTAEWVKSEGDRGLLLASKREVRAKLKLSPDGSDALKTTFAAPCANRPRGGAGRWRAETEGDDACASNPSWRDFALHHRPKPPFLQSFKSDLSAMENCSVLRLLAFRRKSATVSQSTRSVSGMSMLYGAAIRAAKARTSGTCAARMGAEGELERRRAPR